MTFFTGILTTLRAVFAKGAAYTLSHKVLSGIVLLILIGVGYWGYTAYAASVTTTEYVLTPASTGTIAVTVTGSGEVSASHQLNLSPKASGTVSAVYVKAGDSVSTGTVVAALDATDAEKSLRDARTSLLSAKISYEQSIASSKNSSENAHSGAYDAATSAFGTLPGIMTALQDTIESSTLRTYALSLKGHSETADSQIDSILASYNTTKTAYAKTFALYQQLNRDSSAASLLELLASTYDTARLVNQTVKEVLTYTQYVDTQLTTHNNLIRPDTLSATTASYTTYTTQSASVVSNTSSARNTLATSIQSLPEGNGQSLSEQSAVLTMQRAQSSYDDAVDALDDYVVRAPFAGTIASVDVQVYDTAGSGTAVATLITKQQYANLSMNETDAAKVKAGQKATITFDAIDDLTLDGTVAEVSGIGTVSSGVVSYTVKIGFDTTDERILPGMTANATIETASKEQALIVPNSAVKSMTVNGTTMYYVQVAQMEGASPTGAQAASSTAKRIGETGSTTMRTGAVRTWTVSANDATLERVPVTVGLINDTMTEITSGVSEGQFVVTQSLNASGKTTSPGASVFNLFGGGSRTTTRTSTTGTTGSRTTTGASATRTTGAGGPPPGGF